MSLHTYIFASVIRPSMLGGLLFAAALTAQADPGALSSPSPWFFSGYGTLGYSHESNAALDFKRDLSQQVETPRSGSWLTDTRIGLQGGYRFGPQTEAVAQLVLRDMPNTTVANSLKWAYVAHRPFPELQLRAGRVGMDVFLLSDYRNVGYAHSTVRPPTEFYGFLPLYSIDGADMAYSLDAGDARWIFKTQAGRGHADLPVIGGAAYHFSASNFWDFSLIREQGPLRVKAAFATLKVTSEAPLDAIATPLAAATALPGAVGAEAGQLLGDMRFAGGRLRYLAFGASYDDGTWLAQGELGRISGDRLIYVQGTAAYALVGRRSGDFTPFVGISGFRPSHAAAAAQNDWTPFLGSNQLRDAALLAINSARIDQRTLSLGLRWDFHRQASLKLQWDRTQIRTDGYGLWHTAPGMPLRGERVNLLSAGIDWMF